MARIFVLCDDGPEWTNIIATAFNKSRLETLSSNIKEYNRIFRQSIVQYDALWETYLYKRKLYHDEPIDTFKDYWELTMDEQGELLIDFHNNVMEYPEKPEYIIVSDKFSKLEIYEYETID